MPRGLIDATRELRDRVIDHDTYTRRLTRRTDYLLTPKARTDTDGYRPMRCPAADPSPTLACPLKPPITPRPDLPTVLTPPADPPRLCSNRESTTFGPEDGAKHAQDLQYGTPAWHARYAGARNTVEGLNAHAKDPAYSDLAEPGRRRLRGYTAQLLAVSLITASGNIRKIRSHLRRHNQKPAPPAKTSHNDRRRHPQSLSHLHPDPHTPPTNGPAANLR